MALFKKFFAPADPLSNLRKAFSRGQWADVLSLGNILDPGSCPAEVQVELADLLQQAGDRLAEINLTEAEAFFRAGDEERALEHLGLAANLAVSANLRGRVAEVRAANEKIYARPAEKEEVPAPACGCDSGCGPVACAPDENDEAFALDDSELDLDSRLELCLGGYPPGTIERYLTLDEELKTAIVAAHSGATQAARETFCRVAESARNADYHYEFGILLGRCGETEVAIKALQHCLAQAPGHALAGEVLFGFLVAAGHREQAGAVLQDLESGGLPPAFCLARRAILGALDGDYNQALAHAEAAFQNGNREGDLLVLLGQLLERRGSLDRAEEVFALTAGGGGCGGGGISVPFAEFCLRHKRQLDRVLEGFKSLWQQDPGNPKWMLRTAQTYLAKGWTAQGRQLLQKLLARDDIPATLHDEARAALEAN